MTPFIPGNYLQKVQTLAPLIHCITNYVTCRDCANILLACGASPIMADEPEEAAEITEICNGLLLNIGTLHLHTIGAMFRAGSRACALGHPIVFDPVGAGASKLRKETAQKVIAEFKPAVIRGNISEILTLACGSDCSRGVDANAGDSISSQSLPRYIEMARDFSQKIGAIVAISGETDIITEGKSVCLVRNGCSAMPKITGSGCMLSALTTAFTVATGTESADPFLAVAAAHCAMGLAGEIAWDATRARGMGTGAFVSSIIDSIFNMTGDMLNERANYDFC